MNKILIRLSILLFVGIVMVNCVKDEIRYIDPMIVGITDNIDNDIDQISSSVWNVALIGLRKERVKLAGMIQRIETGGYVGDNYSLANPEESKNRVNVSLQRVEFLMDSLWNANIQAPFNDVDKNSAGIQNFGLKAYGETENKYDDIFMWLMAESAGEEEDPYVAFDLENLADRIFVLLELTDLDNDAVNEYVNSIKTRFSDMQQQYADLENEINTSPYFSTQQKEIYANLQGILDEMAVTMEEDLSLDTVDELDEIDRDLDPLVYFVDNNYTSPPQRPLVYGEIARITELRWLSEKGTSVDYSSDWKLVNHIDAAETRRWNDGVGYLPIDVDFTGVFDGQFYMISGLFMNQPPDGNTGLISQLSNGGQIKNLGMVNVDIEVKHPFGGVFAGIVRNSYLTNCFSTGHVVVKGNSGSIVGRSEGSVFTNCFTLADTEYGGTGGNCGPFAGWAEGPTEFNNCYAASLVFGSDRGDFNGFVGSVRGDAYVVNGVYWSSEISGKPNASNTGFKDLESVINLPAASWNDLANFPTFSADEWEIKIVPQIDSNPRPYLKGFNYDALEDFIVP